MEVFTARVDRIRWKQGELSRNLEVGFDARRATSAHAHRFDALAVHQMGKVGSMSLHEAVRNLGLWPCFHTHVLNPSHKGLLRANGEPLGSHHPAAVPPHIFGSRELCSQYLDAGSSVGVISAIREPIARNLSAFFMNLDRFVGPDQLELDDADGLYERFRSRYPHHLPQYWLERELNEVFGIDVFASLFPGRGSTVLDAPPHRILIMRTSLPDEAKAQAICSYLGVSTVSVGRAHVTEDKPGLKSIYRKVGKLVGRDRDYIDAMLGMQMALHFFTAQEREEIKERWLAIGKSSD
jgi:hypothetical protein